MRSLIIAVHMLKADEIIVMGHHDCGMQNINTDLILEKMKERGVSEENTTYSNTQAFCGP